MSESWINRYQKHQTKARFLTIHNLNMHHFWWVVISLVNILLLSSIYITETWNQAPIAALSIGNLLLAVLVRNELIVHLLYRLAVGISRIATSGKYYINTAVHYIGGVHAAAATWSCFWLSIDLYRQLTTSKNLLLLTTGSLLAILLLAIILTAIPPFRERFHNSFEKIHRYAGWSCLAGVILYLTLSQFLATANQIPTLEYFLNPIFLMLILIIFSIFLPWLTVQKCENFSMYCPSPNVAFLTVPGKADIGTFARISTDLVEWHSFSVAGMSFNQETGRSQIQLIIGAAGDWTKNLIEKVQRGDIPKYFWVRRVKPPGFMFSINAYSRVVVVATGAGIAPVLPHILENKHKLYILWIGNKHQLTYGKKMWSLISSHRRLKIYDTGELGRPNVGDLAIQLARKFRAQAVFCVSNKAVTKTVVSACLAKGIPAYGASWDS